jgi:hypothetical protein
LTNFTVAMGTASLVGSASGTNPVSFTIGPIGKNGTKTFYVGMDVPIGGDDSGKATGSASSGFYVYIAASPTTPTTGSTSGLATATVRRRLSVSKASDLNFGTVVKPGSGSGTVAIDATTGARSFTGGALGTPAAVSRAVYNITGEGGQAFSISIPSSFTMSSGANSLTVTTTATASGAQVLSNSLGSAGSFPAIGVGGSFSVTSSTTSGAYSGTFAVTVNYN